MIAGRWIVLVALATAGCGPASKRPKEPVMDVQGDGAWTEAQAREVMDRVLEVELAPDLSALTAGERAAVDELRAVGAIFQELHERSLHPQAARAREALAAAGPGARTDALRALFRLNHGPIATTLDNQRVPFLPVEPEQPGKNVYPWAITRERVDGFLARHPEERARILALRTVVRETTDEAVARDVAALDRHPVLDALHPGLRTRIQRARATGLELYAVPYAVAYADEVVRASARLQAAAAHVEADDPEFAGYLRHRSRDLLVDDYEAGDAAWVTGRFRRLNAQIGAYEEYDDALYGAKAFWALSILVRDEAESARLRDAMRGFQALEDALPYASDRQVRSDIPVGVYAVIADYGQARSANTATILPNEAMHARKYGRTILLRANVLLDPAVFADARAGWEAAVAPAHRADLVIGGGFARTLWHEVGHYLGPDVDAAGRPVGEALAADASLLEELKADLVSLYTARSLRERGHLDDAALRGFYASGILRVLPAQKPRREQAYKTMQLMQLTWFLDAGLLGWSDAGLVIDYDRYHEVVGAMLAEVIRIQIAGDATAAAAFVDRWSQWGETQQAVAARVLAAQRYRFTLVRYALE